MIPIDLTAPEYKMDQATVPSVSASASRDKEGRLHLSIVNLDPNRSVDVATQVEGLTIKNISGEVLTSAAMNDMNTFENPNTIKPAPFTGYKLQNAELTLNIPAKSVVVIELR